MKEYKLLKYYPSLVKEWKTVSFPIMVVEREDGYHLHPSMYTTARGATLDKSEVEDNEEYWKEITPKKVILITEDKVGLQEGDTYYVPQRGFGENFLDIIVNLTVRENTPLDSSLKFANKENAKNYVKKYKNYITTDGHGIIKGDEFYIYDAKRHTCQRGEFGHFTDSKFDGKRYRKKEEVENLIEFNKKQYSLSDILKAVNNWSTWSVDKDNILQFLKDE